ncbi:MAG: tRNA pseudouridine(38-40) synthase TruA [Deltaproteobacteria bacterium]|nr:MAG: tRNA pseudouridine(38-40) synthase TruA [Deltaproteobacteria bacterium]
MLKTVGRIKLVVAYRGTRYAGWQVQPGQVTVQRLLEQAYEKMTGCRARMHAAARTDAGVHAAHQLVAFDNHSRHGPDTILRGLNHYLPEDVVVLEAETVEDGFSPRRKAAGKHYRYIIYNAQPRPVFAGEFCWHLPYALDVRAMDEAAALFTGEHDFSSMRSSGCTARTTVRRIDFFRCRREGRLVVFDVYGRAFLKQMVRNMVGSLVEVGRGRNPPEWIGQLLAAKDRTRAGPCAPAKGLWLMKVFLDHTEYTNAVESGSRMCSLSNAECMFF